MNSNDCNCNKLWQQMLIENIPNYIMVIALIIGSAGAVKFRHSLRNFFCHIPFVKKIDDKIKSVNELENVVSEKIVENV